MDDFLTRLDSKINEAVRGVDPLMRKIAKKKLELMKIQSRNEHDKHQDRIHKELDTPPVDESYLKIVEGKLNRALDNI